MKIAIAGATGFIGTELYHLLKDEHQLIVISRTPERHQENFPEAECLSWDELEKNAHDIFPSLNAIINLCGAGIANKRWSRKRKKQLIQSRTQPAKTIVELCNQTQTKPTLIQASGIGIYPPYHGKKTDITHTETDPVNQDTSDFLSTLAVQWEAASENPSQPNQRIIKLRFGVVCHLSGGAIKAMLPSFKLCLGGPIGSGQQPFPWIALSDAVHIIQFCLNTPEITGPINVVSPNLITQKQFAKALGKRLYRPTFLPLPAWLVKLLFGEMGRTLLLQGQRAYPQKLIDHHYEFQADNIVVALKE